MPRVTFCLTGLPGDVLNSVTGSSPYMPGTWLYVRWDDGFASWVPDSEVIHSEVLR